MRNNRFWLTYLILTVVQILICNYLRLPLFVMISVLPVMVLLIPIRFGAIFSMLLAFGTALSIDFLAEGVIGLNALAIVPVALCRKSIIKLVFGQEIFARKESISLPKHGVGKMSMAIILALLIYLIIYIIADGAATRPFWYNFFRLVLSTVASWAMSIAMVPALTQDDRDL